ncbi:MAG: U32 family peptidase [Methanoregula sp.]
MTDTKRTGSPEKLPELLAPAGSPESLRAAIAAGADAVYLSGRQFGARKFARNFSDEEIPEAVRSAHLQGVRVYVTVNTLIHDRELPGVAEYLVWLYANGVDAVLVQDIGVAALAKKLVPDLSLHASTQMTIHSADGVKWAAGQGFSRVVLARELSLADVQAIAAETATLGIGLEVFVHGALCYCWSGQCLLSSVVGGRSGNRGMCAQPCRKPYTFVTGDRDAYGNPVNLHPISSKERFLLSPKDLSTYPHLPELARAPVASLKIEGRMKSPEYVATVVSIYRRALDAIAAGTWEPAKDDVQDLLLAFNRGFTKGYIFGDKHAALMGRDQPDNRGLFIGVVTRFDNRLGTVTVQCETPIVLHPGDGLLFSHPDRPETAWGCALNNEPVRTPSSVSFSVPQPVTAGTRLYLTMSGPLRARARQIVAKPPAGLRHPVMIDMNGAVLPDGTLVLGGAINPGSANVVVIPATRSRILVPAESRPLTRDQLIRSLSKTGGTPFAIREFSLDYPGGMFAPIAELNRVRREFLQSTQAILVQSATPSDEHIRAAQDRLGALVTGWRTQTSDRTTSPHRRRVSLAVSSDNLGGVAAAVQAGADCVYFEPTFHPDPAGYQKSPGPDYVAAQIREALACCRDTATRLVWKFPRITRTVFTDMAIPLLPVLVSEGLTECMVDSIGAAQAILSAAPGIRIAGSVGLNVFNHQTLDELSRVPFHLVTLSPELSGTEIADMLRTAPCTPHRPACAVMVQGAVEAMVSEDCLPQPVWQCRHDAPDRKDHNPPFFGIMDETRRIFPVYVDSECRTHLFNAMETCLIDYLPLLFDAGIQSVAIDARMRPPAYVSGMVKIYKEAIAAAQPDSPDASRHLRALKEQARRIAGGLITSGPFLHGLKE